MLNPRQRFTFTSEVSISTSALSPTLGFFRIIFDVMGLLSSTSSMFILTFSAKQSLLKWPFCLYLWHFNSSQSFRLLFADHPSVFDQFQLGFLPFSFPLFHPKGWGFSLYCLFMLN